MTFTRNAMVAALLLGATSTQVVAQSASPLSLSSSPVVARANAGMEGQNSLRERRGPAFYLIGAVVIGLLVWGAIELLDDNDHAFPTSP
jgi:hypothetical protein